MTYKSFFLSLFQFFSLLINAGTVQKSYIPLKIMVYALAFPKEKGYTIVKKSSFPLFDHRT